MISALSSSSAAAIGASSTAPKRPSADEMFKKLDSGDKGYLTQSDFASISKHGADTAKAEEMFKKMDTDGDGKVSEAEFKAADEKMSASRQAGGSHVAHSGQQGGPRAAAVGASGTSSSNKTYDPADTNEDGTVSQQERQAYDAKQQQAQAAVSTYEAVAAAQ